MKQKTKGSLLFSRLVSLIVLFNFGLSSAYASGIECRSFYDPTFLKISTHPYPEVKRKIHDYRTSKIETADISQITVNGITYRVLGILGGDRSRVKVYLCEAPNGKRVQIKRTYDNTTWPNSIYYEMAVTRYYQEMGIIVPKVIDHSVEHTRKDNSTYMTAIIVKDYFEGLTGIELFFGSDAFTEVELDHMNRRLETYRQRVSLAHRGFKDWLKKNNIDLSTVEFSRMDVLLEKGDLEIRNILYNADVDSGIVFDP